jgi:hypothetical protein
MTKTADPVRSFGYASCMELSDSVGEFYDLNLFLQTRMHPSLTVGGFSSHYVSPSLHLGHHHLAKDLLWLPGCTVAQMSTDVFESQHQWVRYLLRGTCRLLRLPVVLGCG